MRHPRLRSAAARRLLLRDKGRALVGCRRDSVVVLADHACVGELWRRNPERLDGVERPSLGDDQQLVCVYDYVIATTDEHTEGFRAAAGGCDLVAYRAFTERDTFPDTGATWTELWLTPVGSVASCVQQVP